MTQILGRGACKIMAVSVSFCTPTSDGIKIHSDYPASRASAHRVNSDVLLYLIQFLEIDPNASR